VWPVWPRSALGSCEPPWPLWRGDGTAVVYGCSGEAWLVTSKSFSDYSQERTPSHLESHSQDSEEKGAECHKLLAGPKVTARTGNSPVNSSLVTQQAQPSPDSWASPTLRHGEPGTPSPDLGSAPGTSQLEHRLTAPPGLWAPSRVQLLPPAAKCEVSTQGGT
jgi:hypothetical protein